MPSRIIKFIRNCWYSLITERVGPHNRKEALMILRSVFYAAVMISVQDFVDRMRLLFPYDYSIFVGCGNPVRVRAIKRAHYKLAKDHESWVFVRPALAY